MGKKEEREVGLGLLLGKVEVGLVELGVGVLETGSWRPVGEKIEGDEEDYEGD